jgi:hypothetical protein
MKLSEAMALYDEKRDDKIDFVEFKVAEEKYPIIMWPVFELQGQMRLRVLGLKFWRELFSRVHPHLVIPYFEDYKDDLRDRVKTFIAELTTTLKTFLPCIRLFGKRHNLSAENLRAHEVEVEAITRDQDPNKDPMLFDGLHVIQADAASNVDSEESIVVLTDNDEYDEVMYLPKNVRPGDIKKKSIFARQPGTGK